MKREKQVYVFSRVHNLIAYKAVFEQIDGFSGGNFDRWAQPIPDRLFAICTVVTLYEAKAAALTEITIEQPEDACKAAAVFLNRSVKQVAIILERKSCCLNDGKSEAFIPALHAKAADTTGSGDAFNGALAAALSNG